jgi:predicted dehydrogenase
MEAVLALMAGGRLDVRSLTTHRFPFGQALSAYHLIQEGGRSYVGILLDYDASKPQEKVVSVRPSAPAPAKDEIGVGFVGAGNYAALHLLPHLRGCAGVRLRGLVTATGLSARQKADKFGFAYCATDIGAVLEDESVDAVFIATRHSTHADYTIRALEAGKHVFVEKPLVVNEEQLEAVSAAYRRANEQRPARLVVGLNRRFAPISVKLKAAFDGHDALQMIYRVNSGAIPVTTWLHEPEEGRGMLVGEMCHFVDLMQFVSGERPASVYARSLRVGNRLVADHDNLAVVISFDGGSVGTLCYNTVGSKNAPKERLEVYGGGTVAVLDDFRRLEIMAELGTSRVKASNQDKGQAHQVAATIKYFRGVEPAPIRFDELSTGMRVIFAAQESLKTGGPVELSGPQFRQEMIA